MPESLVHKSFARAGLLGNPSDGYGGKTIALSIGDFAATVEIAPAKSIQIVPAADDLDRFESRAEMLAVFRKHGLYGGRRLVKATLQCFLEFCVGRHALHDRNFSMAWRSDIPRCVGLAGSSAIVTATLKALCDYYAVEIEADVMAALALHVETDYLGIPAGPQDRVIQMLEGLVFMDFGENHSRIVDGMVVGTYERLPVGQIARHLFVAYADAAAEPTEVLHNNLSKRFASGETVVVAAMQKFAELAEQGRAALAADDLPALGKLIDANFDLRQSICQLPAFHQQMVSQARSAGGTAKFCGSGGAIIGTFADEQEFDRIHQRLQNIGCHVIRPVIKAPTPTP